ncbi:hypothetical protein [Peribacillus deserti]|uniref:Uncharacterized protein n=1 Tax=Peribacillus deserti TaxID=673318 RepID=A0A2N5LZU3_9BACI|nr:hypothetical protein [Peribacillus deserti]PLT27647.1 hypothetical protein CUU66_22795 [Peribacillus deserti]
MWESIIEIDFHTLRTALWLGLLITVFLPAAFLYISYGHSQSHSKKDSDCYRYTTAYSNEQRGNGDRLITKFIGFIRRKQPQNSDEPFSNLLY